MNPLLAVGAQLVVVAVLIILAGNYPAPVMMFVALLWMLFLINRAGSGGAANNVPSSSVRTV